MNDRETIEMRAVFAAQQHLIQKIKSSVNILQEKFEGGSSQEDEINRLERSIEELEQDTSLLKPEDLSGLKLDDIKKIYQDKQLKVKNDLLKIEYKNWDAFVNKCIEYCNEQKIDPFLPYESYLTTADYDKLKSESHETQYRWDKWDYIFVGTAGVLAALTDFFLVAIPKDINIGNFKGQQGSAITKWLNNLKLPPSLQGWLENNYKVPYDNTGGSLHRIDTLGHDPVLGFIFGTIAILRSGITKNPLEALLHQFLHLVSDVTTNRGLPIPFGPVLRGLEIGSFPRSNGKTATIGQLVGWMYHNGYDLRHFITMGITPATIEIILRLYLMIRHYYEKGETKILLAGNPKYRSMLLTSHSIAAATNIGKVAIYQGNPVAINYAEWLALLRYLMPSIKYWLFDKNRFAMAHITRINEESWNELLQNSYVLLKKARLSEIEMIKLGVNKYHS